MYKIIKHMFTILLVTYIRLYLQSSSQFNFPEESYTRSIQYQESKVMLISMIKNHYK